MILGLSEPAETHLRGLAADWLPPLARLAFVAGLGGFFWRSALTKLDGFGLSAGAYAQILPRTAEAAGYDPAAVPLWAHGIVAAGTFAEFLLPMLILIGLATRPAALGMIGFVAVMSATDVWGHGAALAEVALPRLPWLATLAVPLALGGGALSLDRLLRRSDGPGGDDAGTRGAPKYLK